MDNIADFRWVRRAAHGVWVCLGLGLMGFSLQGFAKSVTLAWDPSTDPTVAGYNIYCGSSSRNYTNITDAGVRTSVTMSNLVPGATYYFAATTYTLSGLESDYSAETAYAVPITTNPPPINLPTIDAIPDISINENSGPRTVNLTGISAGAGNPAQFLAVNALSSNPALVPNPTVNYTSPNSTGSLTFTPAANSFGSVTMTVMVDDSAPSNNAVIRSFTVTVVPVNSRPTLDPIANLSLNANSGPQTVTLTGIGSGAPNELQTLTVLANSSNPSLIPNPTVTYSSPNSTALLSFAPLTNASGQATLTVTVDDGQATNSAISHSFTVTVNSTGTDPGLLTNAVVAPNTTLRYLISPPYPNGDRFTYSLAAGAPSGAKVSTAHGLTYLTWTPTSAQALTTNLISIVINDLSNPTLNTNQMVLVTVLDFLNVRLGSISVPAGQSALLPIYLSSSSGVTNLSFSLDWPANLFNSPTLLVSAPGIATNSLQVQQTNLLITLQAAPGQVLQRSNLVAQLSFQTLPGQPSAFVPVAPHDLWAAKPDGSTYVNYVPAAGQVAVVNSKPLLAPATTSDTTRTLTAFGNVGTSYQLQYATNPVTGPWSVLLTYTQTNTAQTLWVDPSNPLIFYRVIEQ